MQSKYPTDSLVRVTECSATVMASSTPQEPGPPSERHGSEPRDSSMSAEVIDISSESDSMDSDGSPLKSPPPNQEYDFQSLTGRFTDASARTPSQSLRPRTKPAPSA